MPAENLIAIPRDNSAQPVICISFVPTNDNDVKLVRVGDGVIRDLSGNSRIPCRTRQKLGAGDLDLELGGA